MKLLLVAVGTRMPGWVDEACQEFARRMPRESALHLVEIRPEPRTGGKPADALRAAEGQRIEQALPARCRRVVLDERGTDVTTAQLAARLKAWMGGGEDVALIVGGPDGLAPAIRHSAAETLRLSSLTLPHALVRVLLAEQLYRASSMLRNHPYHRA
ncbi:MAG: 23S rRNA (pseudouridine(1915)-N(3))-methyltransferase RlmH [Betaproteobacteria bacterium]|nr:23S rRNA (pseudouridine(1915)-N(3))-methyltransferase RlmH [Betaproteobacteria bacterium]